MNDLLGVAATGICWGLAVVVWAVGAVQNGRRGPRQRTHARFAPSPMLLIGAIAGCVILAFVVRAFGARLEVNLVWVRILGLVILLPSTAFTLWARLALGTMWSFGSIVKEHHELRTDGPYAITRHPIYTGLLGMLLGTTLLNGVAQLIVLVPVGIFLLTLKAVSEERLLLHEFPGEYARYRSRVSQLVPGLTHLPSPWRRRRA